MGNSIIHVKGPLRYSSGEVCRQHESGADLDRRYKCMNHLGLAGMNEKEEEEKKIVNLIHF